jgi:hypothetical protein
VRAFLAALVLYASAAAAAPPDLRVRRVPRAVPRTLAIREATPEPPPKPAPATRRYDRLPTGIDDLSERVVFRFQLGYEVAQAQYYPAPRDVLPSGVPVSAADIRDTRLYTFGDVVAGTRGLLTPSLLTYFAAHFLVDQDGRPGAAVVPSAFDGFDDPRAVLVRSAFGEIDGLKGRLWAPLRVRAGRQFRQGMAITHFDGLSFGYETRVVDLALWGGRRVALWGPRADPFAIGQATTGRLGGAEGRLRLGAVGPMPVTLAFELMSFDDDGHFSGSLTWNAGRDVIIAAGGRVRGSELAHWRAGVRARLGRSTTLAMELDHRLASDFVYDFIVPGNGGNAPTDDDPTGRLSLGIPASRTRLAFRAGTFLFDNLDVLVVAAAQRQADELTSISPTHAELGLGLETRLRAGLSVGATGRSRRFAQVDTPMTVPFGQSPADGERAFDEIAGELRYSLGRRRFGGEIEGYFRRSQLVTAAEPDPFSDLRGGGRFRVEGWLAGRLHVLAEYELVGAADRKAPELAGIQSLRLILEGAF